MRYRKGTFHLVPIAVTMDGELSKVALRVALFIATMKGARCWMSTRNMATALKCARSAIITGLAELVHRGHVVREERPGASSVYVLQFRTRAEFSPGGPKNWSRPWSEKQVTPDQGGWSGVTRGGGHDSYSSNYKPTHKPAAASTAEPTMLMPINGGRATDATHGQRRHEHEARHDGEGSSSEHFRPRSRPPAQTGCERRLAGPDGPMKNRLSSHRYGDPWPDNWGPDPSGSVPNPKIPEVTWHDWLRREGRPVPSGRAA